MAQGDGPGPPERAGQDPDGSIPRPSASMGEEPEALVFLRWPLTEAASDDRVAPPDGGRLRRAGR